MTRRFNSLLVTSLILLIALSISSPVQAAPRYADSAYDLINAVNALRASNGLAAYSISPILMYTAQNQADFMAATGMVTHSGPGGIGLTDRLLAAGYPLAGDLSLGGFRAENIISGGEDMSAASAVDAWTGDAPHLNTMLSPNLSEIGAGVAIADGRVYYVIDAALPKNGGVVSVSTQVVGGGSVVPTREAVISTVAVSTPNPSGDVIHEVLPGQTLWGIAISYGVKIDDIKRLNNLSGNDIYPREKLLIKKEISTPTAIPTETAAVLVDTITPTSTPIPTFTDVPATLTPTVVVTSSPTNNAIAMWVIGILALAILSGAVFAWMGKSAAK